MVFFGFMLCLLTWWCLRLAILRGRGSAAFVNPYYNSLRSGVNENGTLFCENFPKQKRGVGGGGFSACRCTGWDGSDFWNCAGHTEIGTGRCGIAVEKAIRVLVCPKTCSAFTK